MSLTGERRCRPARLYVGEEILPGIGAVSPMGVVIVIISVVSPLVKATFYDAVTLDYPYKLLNGVVEIELNLYVGRGDGFITSELKLLNKILVGDLGHTAALIGIKEYVIYEKCGVVKGRYAEASITR